MSVIKSFAVLLVGLLVTVNAISERCGAKCEKSYSEETHQGQLKEPCKRGCRLFYIHDATRNVDPFFPFDLRQIGWNNPADDTLNKCSKDCSSAYSNKDNGFANACIQGCGNGQQVGNEQIRRDDGPKDGFTISFGNPGLFDFNTNIFDDLDRMIARTRSNLPSLMSFPRGNNGNDKKETIEAGKEGTPSFHSIFDSVHQNVQGLMQNVLDKFNQHMVKEVNNDDNVDNSKKQSMEVHADGALVGPDSEAQSMKGSGRLVVIQDGPGYHEEKTYNLGPNADVGKIFNEKMNDMLEHSNPLENFFKQDDVEMIDPLKISKQREEDKEENKKEIPKENHEFDIQVLGPFMPTGLKDASSEESREDNNILGLNFDDWSLGPKLPETGLKSRPLPIFTDNEVRDNNIGRMNIVIGDRSYEDVCSQDSRQMKWSDWVSCLHTRLGLPRWLMAATVCLGIIFTLWICLVIPANAPKQRVKKAKKSVGTKELEANSLENPHLAVIAVHKEYPLDLPPSYDDVTKTKVNLAPVHEKPAINLELDTEAGELPEKTSLSNESQA